MKKKLFVKRVESMALIAGTILCISACGLRKSNTTQETTVAETTNEEAKKLLINQYGLTEDELKDIDTDKFVADYELSKGGYTEAAIRELFDRVKEDYKISDGDNAEETTPAESQSGDVNNAAG